MIKQVISKENVEEIKPVEFQLYDFMNDPRFKEMETAVEYVDFFMNVKQDVLNKLDAVNCSIVNAKLNINHMDSEDLLNVNFNELYGKDNESIRKSHLQKVNQELYEQLEGLKFQRNVYLNQVDILNDIIKANQILLGQCDCNCNHGDECNGGYI